MDARLLFMLSLEEDFLNLQENLNIFLSDYLISTRTDVFEETVLALAGIKTQPKECHFKSDESGQNIHFQIVGLPYADKEKLINFFKFVCNDAANKASGYGDHFYLSIDKANEFLLPLFKKKIAALEPAKLEAYQSQTRACDGYERVVVRFLGSLLRQVKQCMQTVSTTAMVDALRQMMENIASILGDYKETYRINKISSEKLLSQHAMFSALLKNNEKQRRLMSVCLAIVGV